MTELALAPVPSEKPARNRQECQNEYAQLCAKAGNIQYQMYALQRDLEALNGAMVALNQEAAKLQADDNAKLQSESKEAANA